MGIMKDGGKTIMFIQVVFIRYNFVYQRDHL